jgi:hypothetical protein
MTETLSGSPRLKPAGFFFLFALGWRHASAVVAIPKVQSDDDRNNRQQQRAQYIGRQ